MKALLFTLLLQTYFQMNIMDKPAYKIFDKEGKSSSYENLLEEAKKADIVLFGELHNNPICHWLQLELTQDLFVSKKDKLKLGAEMFEADNQIILNEYLADIITEKHLSDEAKLWNNYATDYKPLVEFAKENKLTFIATNVPRRYASLVAKQGLEGLENLAPEAKNWLAPLPIQVDLEMPAYANMLKMMGSHGGDAKVANFAKAQAIKDATMAHFILKDFQKGQTLIHYNGSYHSDNFESIVWYLKKQNPSLKILTISTVEQANLEKLDTENQGKANFILTINENMTKTY